MTELILALFATAHTGLESKDKKFFLSLPCTHRGDKPVPVPFYLQQVPIGPSWNRNRVSAITDGKTEDNRPLGKCSPGFEANIELVQWDVRAGVQKSLAPGCLGDKIMYGGT
jgi:hypothetical protein